VRKLLVAAAATAIACGSSNSSSSTSQPTGTIAGGAFTPAEVVAVTAGPASCTVTDPTGSGQKVTLGVAAIAVGLGSFKNVCADFQSPFCTLHRSAKDVTVLLASLAPPFPGLTAQIVPGTYTVSPSLTTTLPDPTRSGMLYAAGAISVGTDASCVPTSGAGSGSLRIDTVNAAQVTGHVDLTFSDGGKLSGDFTAPVCTGVSPDLCALAVSQGACTSGTPQCQ
jgi:hypothetical protein